MKLLWIGKLFRHTLDMKNKHLLLVNQLPGLDNKLVNRQKSGLIN